MKKRNPIEKGMLPLLDIAMLLFGILIIVLTYAKFQNVEGIEKDNSVSIGINLSLEKDSTERTQSEDIESDPASIVENLVTRAREEGKLIVLVFNTEGVIRYKEKILFDGEFNLKVLELLIESIEENDPMLIVGYPETKGYNKTTRGLVRQFKTELENYSDSIFFLGIDKNKN